MLAAPPVPTPSQAVVIEQQARYGQNEIREGRMTLVARYSFDRGRIQAVLDTVNDDYHIDARPDYSPTVMRLWLKRLASNGYTPIPEEEHEAELLDNGSVRIYLNAERGALIL